MKTLISIIENSPGEKSSFGAVLSRKTKIPLFDLSSYREKYGPSSSGGSESKVLANLLNDIGLKTAILDNANAEDALRVSKSFSMKIVFLTSGESNKLTNGLIGKISSIRTFSNFNTNIEYPDNVRIKAELIKEINPVLLLSEDLPDRENHWIWRITEALKK